MNGNGDSGGGLFDRVNAWIMHPLRSPDNKIEFWIAFVFGAWILSFLWAKVIRQVLDV
jgi:hypothetical protein